MFAVAPDQAIPVGDAAAAAAPLDQARAVDRLQAVPTFHHHHLGRLGYEGPLRVAVLLVVLAQDAEGIVVTRLGDFSYVRIQILVLTAPPLLRPGCAHVGHSI